MTPKYKRIVIKIGSNVLTREDGTLDTTRMSALADQISGLHKAGMEVISRIVRSCSFRTQRTWDIRRINWTKWHHVSFSRL